MFASERVSCREQDGRQGSKFVLQKESKQGDGTIRIREMQISATHEKAEANYKIAGKCRKRSKEKTHLWQKSREKDRISQAVHLNSTKLAKKWKMPQCSRLTSMNSSWKNERAKDSKGVRPSLAGTLDL